MTGTKYEVEKFNGKKDFSLWQRRMKDLLIQQSLHKALLGKEKKPTTMTDTEWEEMDEKAASAIRLNLSDEVIHNVLNADTAEAIWKKLESLYMGKNMTNKLYVKKQLYGLQMQEGADLLEHFNDFNSLITQLSNFGVKFEEEDKAILLLASLPDSYDHLVTTLLYGKDTLVLEDVSGALLSHQKRKKLVGDDSQAEGLVARFESRRGRSKQKGRSSTTNESRSKSRPPANDVECHYCHKLGHYRRSCNVLKRDLEDKKNQKSPESVSVAEGKSDDGDADLLSVVADSHILEDSWILDSGCSYHMCPNKEWFDTFKPHKGGTVLMGNDASCKVLGIGSVKIKMFDGIVRTFNDVRYVPELKKNLISLGLLDSQGCTYTAEGGKLKITKGALVIMKGQKTRNLYKLVGNTVVGGVAISTQAESSDDTALWHMRLGHMGERGMMELHKRNLLKGVKSCKMDFCKYCLYGKQRRIGFKAASHTSEGVLDYIHSDVWGPVSVSSHSGARYFVTFIDDYSRKLWIYFIRHKSEVFSRFRQWKAEVENQTGRKIKYLRSDNGLEYKDSEFMKFCSSEGITRHFTVKGTPQQNGVAERMNRTLLERARCMRLNAGLPKIFWAEAVNMACYITNRAPSSGIDFKIPEEQWSGKPVNFENIKIFGCPAYVHVQSGERSKLDPRSRKCIFLGFEKGVKGYRLWDPISKKKVVSRDVVFDETYMLKKNDEEVSADSQKQTVEVEFDEQRSLEEREDNQELGIDPQQQQEEPYSLAKDRERRVHKAPERYGFEDMLSFALVTWDVVKLPRREKAIGCKWVYRKKEALSQKEGEKGLMYRLVPTEEFKHCLN